MPGVTMTDLDEAANRIAVGVDDEALAESVWLALEAAGVPREAVTIELIIVTMLPMPVTTP